MNFKTELLSKIIAGEKTQTRRPVHKVGNGTDDFTNHDSYVGWQEYGSDAPIMVVYRNGRPKWKVGSDYAAAPGRGKRGVARILIQRIRRQDVRDISDEDVRAEGFEQRWQFLAVWMGFYDKTALRTINSVSNIAVHAGIPWGAESVAAAESYLRTRPNHLYDGWALSFVLHEDQPALLSEVQS